MAYIGFLSLYATGHLNPSLAFGRALRERGHTVTFFNLADTRQAIEESGLRFVPFALEEYPEGSLTQVFERIGRLQGADGFQYFLERMITLARASFRDLPGLIEANQMDALVIDQLFPGGATVAQHLCLSYASLANAAPANREPGVPPPTLPWCFGASESGIARNEKGWQQIAQALMPWRDAENAQRKAWKLKPYDDVLEDSFSPLAQIAQMVDALDFPRKELPRTFHCVGPLHHTSARRQVSFDWRRLNGKPLIYASLRTLQNGQGWIFRAILDACATLDAQVVLSLGGGSLPKMEMSKIPKNVVLLSYAPQRELLARARLCITHAGLNTALDALAHGVPMIAIPITNDQPGVAARIQWTGTGESLPLDQLQPERLRELIVQILSEPH
ncbi:glycosyl transferase [Alloacidobacterium dinghuense]|uniref:Glycosyl transferase n=1 Tax=Alloacidobacterium dinghuense TaxID=2763107 RepID=A0A7G8BGT7_9BACT|nr:nucleotide disphospho-sugar-binding domain-containing protein [Alloacidobacterium dinghuense]QNI31757.1 glycosyl transferase [Alloacidobacterium dinghuense]